ncbi:Protein of unknown function [Cotesia congregata]|uniref:Endonuclease/exonuclease/phosphatase domain-containing protein n=1 Tax=Cotesia congregata TaxID=51543 RepID=A0A8J2MX56_COTCN|nr:Protein of unknown function [Cotesia congregata]
MPAFLNTTFWNCRNINNLLDISSLNHNIICISETWRHTDNTSFPGSFASWKSSWCQAVKDKTQGRAIGGLLTICDKSCNMVTLSSSDSSIFTKLTRNNFTTIIGSIYWKPTINFKDAFNALQATLSDIMNLTSFDVLIVGGDFNSRVGEIQHSEPHILADFPLEEHIVTNSDHFPVRLSLKLPDDVGTHTPEPLPEFSLKWNPSQASFYKASMQWSPLVSQDFHLSSTSDLYWNLEEATQSARAARMHRSHHTQHYTTKAIWFDDGCKERKRLVTNYLHFCKNKDSKSILWDYYYAAKRDYFALIRHKKLEYQKLDLKKYCDKNSLNVNTQKTKILFCKASGRLSRKTRTFLYKGQGVEVVKSCVYLGIPFTTSTSGTLAAELASKKAKIAAGAVLSTLARLKLDTWPSKTKLFNCMVKPTLTYQALIWGLDSNLLEKLETSHLYLFKRLFSLPICTPNYALRLELRIGHISVEVIKNAMNWIIRILKMPDSRLPNCICSGSTKLSIMVW